MAQDYDIANLFLLGFGLKVNDAFNIDIKDKPTDPKGAKSNIEFVDVEENYYGLSAVGTPIVSPITFESGNYQKYNNKGEIIRVDKGEFRLPLSSVITTMNRAKLMTETPINGGRGSVKEIYGFENWKINIFGFIIPDDTQPQGLKTVREQEKAMASFDELAESVGVICDLLIDKQISYLTLLSITFESIAGSPNVRKFIINAESDEPLILNIKSQVGI